MANPQPEPLQNPTVKHSLELLQRLLSPARVRTQLVSGRPLLAAHTVGALAVVGMKTVTPKTWVSVFIFATYNEATAGLRAVTRTASHRQGEQVISAVNGRMVLYGRGVAEGADADLTRHVLNNILSAFDED